MQVSYYKSLLNTTDSVVVSVDAILGGIKSGKAKNLVTSIRTESDKNKRASLKKQLAAVCFSGVFERRSDSAIQSHSGIICLDFDGYQGQDLQEAMRFFKNDEYTYAAFVSPSGKGIKVLVKIPAESDTHTNRFDSLKEYYNSEFFDVTSRNLSRVCFMSYDPSMYHNTESKMYMGIKEAVKPASREYSEVLIPVTDKQTIVTRLVQWHNKNHNMNEGGRNNGLFVLAIALSEHGVSLSEAEAVCLQYEQSDFKAEEILVAVGSAYSDSAKFNTKVLEDNDTLVKAQSAMKRGDDVNAVRDVLLRENVPADKLDNILETLEKEKTLDVFWTVSDKGKVTISNHDMDAILSRHGFTRANFSGHNEFVRVSDNIASPIESTDIKDFVINDIIRPYDNKTVFDAITKDGRLFHSNNLDMLKSTQLTMNKDTATTSFVYFRNGVVVLTKGQDRQFIPLSEVGGCVWKDSVIDYDYVDEAVEDCDFKTFITNVSNQDEERIKSMESSMGYLLHNYKDADNPKAIVLYDEHVGDGANGGTGKSLFADAISEIRKSVSIDGKNVKTGSNFMYQRVTLDTRILDFDDVTKNFEFEKLFSVITEGVTVEKKGADEFQIPFEDSPKIIVSSNYALQGFGSSFERRTHTLEFHGHYSPKLRPSMVAGRRFFEKEWLDSGEFNKFYNYMLQCLQGFLDNGLYEAELLGDRMRKFRTLCPPELVPLFQLDEDECPFFARGQQYDFDEVGGIFTAPGVDAASVPTGLAFHNMMYAYGWLRFGANINGSGKMLNGGLGLKIPR